MFSISLLLIDGVTCVPEVEGPHRQILLLRQLPPVVLPVVVGGVAVAVVVLVETVAQQSALALPIESKRCNQLSFVGRILLHLLPGSEPAQ